MHGLRPIGLLLAALVASASTGWSAAQATPAFPKAVLDRADVRGADFCGAILKGTGLRGVDIRAAKDLEEALQAA